MRKKRIPPRLRTEVCERAKHYCEYCRANSWYSESPYHCDHCTAEADGGETVAENLAWACAGCNLNKKKFSDGIDPETGRAERLFNPRLEAWKEHFAWSDDYTEIIGITAIGRATVGRMELNRDELRRQRAVYRDGGLHPPVEE